MLRQIRDHADHHGFALAHLHRFGERLLHDKERQASDGVAKSGVPGR